MIVRIVLVYPVRVYVCMLFDDSYVRVMHTHMIYLSMVGLLVTIMATIETDKQPEPASRAACKSAHRQVEELVPGPV